MVQDIGHLTGGCEYVPNAEAVVSLLSNSPGSLVSIWGVAPVAPLHLGYDSLILRQRALVEAGCRHIVLLADHHAMMSHGLSFTDVNNRALYYEYYLRTCSGLKAQYIRGSSFQMRIDYIEQLFSLTSNVQLSLIKDTIPRAIKQSGTDNAPCVATYLYALMQCLDAWYLGANLVLAEHGQKKIYDLQDELRPCLLGGAGAINTLSKIKHRDHQQDRTCFMYIPVAHDIMGHRLSESSASTRISIHESRASLEAKIKRMFAPPAGQAASADRANALLEYFQNSVFPWRTEPVEIIGEDKRTHAFSNYGELETAYQSGLLHPSECKQALVNALWHRLKTIQDAWAVALTRWVDPVRATGLEEATGA